MSMCPTCGHCPSCSNIAAAVRHCHRACVDKFITRGSSLNGVDSDDDTMLSNSVLWGRPESVKLLLDLGVPLDKTNCMGRTALHMAIVRGEDECAVALINAGAFYG